VGDAGVPFANLSWLYLFGAGFAVYGLAKNWRQFWEGKATAASRQLAAATAFFLLVPVGVLLHEFGHMVAAWTTNSTVLGLHYFIYWGYVEFIPATPDPLLSWYVALAGNFLSYLLGIVCILGALYWRSLRPNLRVVLIQLGVIELVQTLIAYPLLSLDPGFEGDWDTIYSFHAPLASWATLILHGASLVLFIIFLNKNREATYLLRGYTDEIPVNTGARNSQDTGRGRDSSPR
jgi:hypothetical protein